MLNAGLLNATDHPYNQIIRQGRHQIYQGTDSINTVAPLRLCLVAGWKR